MEKPRAHGMRRTTRRALLGAAALAVGLAILPREVWDGPGGATAANADTGSPRKPTRRPNVPDRVPQHLHHRADIAATQRVAKGDHLAAQWEEGSSHSCGGMNRRGKHLR